MKHRMGSACLGPTALQAAALMPKPRSSRRKRCGGRQGGPKLGLWLKEAVSWTNMPGSRYLLAAFFFAFTHASFVLGYAQCICPSWAHAHGRRRGLVAAASPMCLASIAKLRYATRYHLGVPPASTVSQAPVRICSISLLCSKTPV